MFDRVQFKLDAKAGMRAHSPMIYIVTLVMMAINYVLGALTTRLEMPGVTRETLLKIRLGYFDEHTLRLLTQQRPGLPATLLIIALSLMTIMLSVGYISYLMRAGRNQDCGVTNLLDGFPMFLKLIWLSILQAVFIFLWTLLLVVPGIIAAYRYSMAFYIQLDHPEMSAMDCIRASKAMTRGHKGQLFVLDLSFIGWYLLCIIPFVSIYVSPYVGMTRFKVYEWLSVPTYTGP